MFKDHFLRAPWLQKWLEITRILYAKLQVGDITMWWGPVSVFSVQAYHQNLQSQGTLDFGAAIAFMPHSSMTSLHSAPKLNAYQFRGKTFCRVLIDGDFIIFNHYPLNLKNTYALRSMSTFCWQYIIGGQIQDSKTDGASNVLRRRRSWLRARGISGSPWLVSGEPCLAEKICCSGSRLGPSHKSKSRRFWKQWPSCSFSIFWSIAASATDCHSAMGMTHVQTSCFTAECSCGCPSVDPPKHCWIWHDLQMCSLNQHCDSRWSACSGRSWYMHLWRSPRTVGKFCTSVTQKWAYGSWVRDLLWLIRIYIRCGTCEACLTVSKL